MRLQSGEDRANVFTVAGIFDFGAQELNERWVFISLRAAQAMFSLEGGVSTIEVLGTEIFEAEALAGRIAERTGLPAESWMETNAQLLVALRSQGSSSIMIQTFVILAVALGIASVLAVSVVQKAREIGILRATGARTRKVMRIFLIQGGILGMGGALAGIGVAIGNAAQEVKDAADVVVASNDEDGVAEAVKRFVLDAAQTSEVQPETMA